MRDDKRTDGDVGTNNTVRKVRTTVVRAEFPVGIFLVFKNHRSRLLLLRSSLRTVYTVRTRHIVVSVSLILWWSAGETPFCRHCKRERERVRANTLPTLSNNTTYKNTQKNKKETKKKLFLEKDVAKKQCWIAKPWLRQLLQQRWWFLRRQH